MSSLKSRLPPATRAALPAEVDGIMWRAADAADIDGIFALHVIADPIDHPTFSMERGEIVDRFTSSWIDPAKDAVVGVSTDGEIIAYGGSVLIPGTTDFAEATMAGVVHPDHRGRGIGRVLLAWQEARAFAHLAGIEDSVEGRVTSYTSGDQPALHHLLGRRGFAVVRTFDELSRDVSREIPDVPVPTGLELVDYSERWTAATLDAKNATFADHWGTQAETTEHWDQRAASEDGNGGLRTDTSMLLVDGDEVVAFVLTTANESDWDRLGHPFGYITLVGVRRSQRGKGAAQALITAVLRRYRELGWQRATLHVDTTSPTGADRLYRKLGFEPSAQEIVYGRTF